MAHKNWTTFLPVSEKMLASMLLTPQDQLPALKSVEQMANHMEHLMHCQVRLYQFKYWFGGDDLFAVFGKLREEERDSSGSLP